MDFAFVVRQRLDELGLGQRELANAAEVTESYISQLLRRKKLPPLPNRTDLYEKMSRALGLPRLELARLAALEHHEALDDKWQETPPARFGPMRDLILRKCRPARVRQMRAIFEKQPLGELEQMVTRTLIAVVRDEARTHARDESWLRTIARRGRDSYRQMRVRRIDLLDSDPRASLGDFSLFLDPLIQWWDFDLDDFTLQVELASGSVRRFGFREEPPKASDGDEPGLRKFLRDATLSLGATPEEIDILRRIRFTDGGRPTALFYYRTLQSLRDPLHFQRTKRRPPR
ncbi:MAG TPA: helix-turn-helix transcriptional regulator [Thermoanaerobaculia bacterium]|nr:helix-turn-helix transcriptional regulator [Thermoanaerobaculia bacterium]